jgi:glycosyltransferase involved in cell wall biosynthesis
MRELAMGDSRSNEGVLRYQKSESAIVVGIIRDIEKSLASDMERLSRAFSRFTKLDWFLVESGSNDDSLSVLEHHLNKMNNFDYRHLLIDPLLKRTENMALARNTYLDYLRENSRLDAYQYVIVADFNSLNSKLEKIAVDSCFENPTWDVVTANQVGRYYDAWALRHPLWSPNDCWEQHEFFRKYTRFPESAVTYSMRSRMLRIRSDSEWIEVDSAFGGLAIYKASILGSKARYSGVKDDGKQICEHVPFHSNLKSEGAKIFINPAFINARITDHSRRLTAMFTLLRILRYPIKRMMKKSGNG